MGKKFGVDLSLSRTLLQISIACIQAGRFHQGRSIALAVVGFRPELPQPRCAVASSYLGEQRYQEAAPYLERVLSEFPDCQMAKCLLANSLFKLGKPGGDALLADVIEDGRDPWAVTYARNVDALHSNSKLKSPRGRRPVASTAFRSISG